jgi:hypothetical protein
MPAIAITRILRNITADRNRAPTVVAGSRPTGTAALQPRDQRTVAAWTSPRKVRFDTTSARRVTPLPASGDAA